MVKLHIPFVKSQNGSATCLACAVTSALEISHQSNQLSEDMLHHNILRVSQRRDRWTLEDGVMAAKIYGTCESSLFKKGEAISPEATKDAKRHRAKMFTSIHSYDEICGAINLGMPVIMGYNIRLFDFLKIVEIGTVSSPLHVSTIFGYDADYLSVVNSWGEKWNNKGCFDVSREFILDKELCYKFIAIR